MADPLEFVLDALRALGHAPRRNGQGWQARCPAHDDREPSLTISPGKDQPVVLHCHAGCATPDILAAAGLRPADISTPREPKRDNEVAAYRYVDEGGRLLFEVVRFEPKAFRQRRPDPSMPSGWRWSLGDARRVLYRLPEVVAAIAEGLPVFVVEGEKDVHALERTGLVATTNPGGVKKWRPEYSETLRGAIVVVIADRDTPGRAHARQVAAALNGTAKSVEVCEPAHGKDISDHLAAGLGLDDLEVVDLADDEPEQLATEAQPAEAEGPHRHLEFLSAAELVAQVRAMAAVGWLAKPVFPADAYGVLAAEWKAGKTWADLDLAVSVASGTPWLGLFAIDRGGPVVLFLGEGGRRKMERRLQAVCEARGLCLEGLPLSICLRVPHLGASAHLAEMEEELARTRPVLVILDPLYLAARGAKSSALYEMGELLETIQALCQAAVTALLVVTHWNRGKGNGSERMTGAGPAEWGRVLISVGVRSRSTDPTTKASTVILDWRIEGDEIPDTTFRIRRKVWADDPDDLASPLHYETQELTHDEDDDEDEQPGLPPAARRVLRALEGATDWLTVREIGDRLAEGGWPLKERTIQTALATLKTNGLAASFGKGGKAYSWRSSPAADEDGVTEMGLG